MKEVVSIALLFYKYDLEIITDIFLLSVLSAVSGVQLKIKELHESKSRFIYCKLNICNPSKTNTIC